MPCLDTESYGAMFMQGGLATSCGGSPDPIDEKNAKLGKRNDELARLLCSLANILERKKLVSLMPPSVKKWWKKHQAADRARAEAELKKRRKKKEARAAKKRKRALAAKAKAKLTKEEREALNLK